MAGYVDFFLLPLPKRSLAAYKRMAQRFGRITRELGALSYQECVGDDLKTKVFVPYTRVIKLKPGEVLVSAYIAYRSRADRDKITKKMMTDPRMLKMMKVKPPFDPKRMVCGGFKTLVTLRGGKR